MAKDELINNLDAMVSGLKSDIKTEKRSDRYFDDMEWWMLVAVMRDPDILDEITELITDPKMLKGISDETAHSLIFQAITNLHDDGQEPHFEALYTECEKIRELDPLITSYSRAAIMELDFQSTVRGQMDKDHNRIRGKYCADQVVRRK